MIYRYITNSDQIVVWTEDRGIIGWVEFGTTVYLYRPNNPFGTNKRQSVAEALREILYTDKLHRRLHGESI